jgi:hypothetical protein
MKAVQRSRWGSGLATILMAMIVPACDPSGTTPPPTCTASDDCRPGQVCRDGRCVVPAGVDGGPDAFTPGADTGAADAFVEPPTDAGMIEMPDTNMGWSATDDSDGDTIGDFDEGRASGVDTDADGTPDYLDEDSDGDGVLDRDEAGDAVITTPPVDTDGDGMLDFRDLESDGNGVPDSVEGGADIDGDGRPNARDRDNDGDGLLDTVEIVDPAMPRDSNGDGVPDYNTPDSDGDTITDTEEYPDDTDGDGVPDLFDRDSDGDGYLDDEEAGDANLATPAVDTDGDGTADFRDPDSDGDGLSDEAERGYGTSPTRSDTDGDGVSDLIEVGAGTSPTDGSVSPRTRGDFVFLVPFMQPPDPTRDTLQFSTNLQRADVYFLMDNTGSMGGTITNLQAGLTGTVIPGIVSGIPEAWFGVGGFDDYPLTPSGGFAYGTASCGTDMAGIAHDQAFFQYQTMTSSAAAAQTAVNLYRTNCGADGPESGVAALYALATRDTLGGYTRFVGSGSVPPACPAGHRGAACFRPDAVPIVIVMTDVDQHNRPGCSCNYAAPVPLVGGNRGPSWAATVAALTGLNARVVGVNTSGGRPFLEQLVNETTIALGAPGAAREYVLDAFGGSGLSSVIIDLVRRAAAVPLDVSARARDLADPGETIDAVAAFIDHLEPNTTGAPGLTCTGGFATSDYAGIDGDSFPDTFLNVTPGAPVCFDILPRMNTTVPATLVPQVFRAQIDVLGDGFTPLDDRVVYFLVPPRIPDPSE